MSSNRVGVGMSGGVDSSVSAYLLKTQGYDVIGITMKLIDDEKSNQAISDAREVCDKIGIKHYVIDLVDDFKKIVINNFIETYKNGMTPNPCCVCNKYFKFGLFYKEAVKLGCSFIATGHYANIKDEKIYMSDVSGKDQSYFLYGIDKEVIPHILFPLLNYTDKEETRKIARNIGLSVSSKKDSQEVCFVPNDDYKVFLRDNFSIDNISGDICLKDGTVLGKHNGLVNYTVGQRKGLNISYSEPLYVIKLDLDNNKVIVGRNDDLYNNGLIASDINLFADKEAFKDKVYCKVRSRGNLFKCSVTFSDDKVKVILDEAERAITLGQSVVFYDEDKCLLGGGIIREVF